MTDIPEDIKRVARGIGEDWFGIGHHDSYMLAAQIEAILSSERERCVRIADGWAAEPDPDEVDPYDEYEMGGRSYSRSIAAAIRSPERAGE